MNPRNLNETATVWKIVPDGMGGHTFLTPYTIKCRWEDRSELFLNEKGREEVSNAIVYTDTVLDVGDYIAFGDLTTYDDPTFQSFDSWPIRRFDQIPDLRRVNTTRSAYL